MEYQKEHKGLLERIKEFHNRFFTHPGVRKELEELIPELCESEDELMRKEAISIIKQYNLICKREGDKCWTADSVITWLEKQGEQKQSKDYSALEITDVVRQALQECESFSNIRKDLYAARVGATVENLIKKQNEQKPANKVKPKFEVRDWVVEESGKDTIVKQVVDINRIDNERFGYTLDDGTYFSGSWEDSYRLWKIQDAKDGDVLATKNFVFIFKNIDDSNCVHYYCHYEIYKLEDDNQFGIALPQSLMGAAGVSHYSPATKEQRDTLFKAMADAGYTFDFDKKELKKIEQKPVWSEENLKEFNVEEYYKNPKRKVVTRDGREVEILKIGTKTKTEVPVIAMTDGNDIRFYTTNGRLSLEKETCSDLFFADADCDTCTNDKGCVACENGELYEGKPTDYAKSNEEKVKEMLECDKCPFRKGKDPEHNCNTCFDKKFFLKMAQWKDEQFKQYLDNAFKSADHVQYTQGYNKAVEKAED